MLSSRKDMVEQCVNYFRARPGFERLMTGIRDKYISLSHYGGTVRIENLTQDEKDAFEGFFQKPYGKSKSAQISIELFQKALWASKYSDISVQEIIEGYFSESLESKREQKKREELEWNVFLDRIESHFSDSFSLRWFRSIRTEGGRTLIYVKQLYQENQEMLYETIVKAMQGANAFPVWKGTQKRLDIFATELTGNPHFFDVGTQAYRLLSVLMEAYMAEHPLDQNIWELGDSQYKVERRMELMFHVGLLTDVISNRTVAYGIHLRRNTGELHRGIEGFCEERQPLTVMLQQLEDAVEAYGEGDYVYVFENPSVFTEFVRKYHDEKITAVCTNGQLMFSSLLLLDLLVKSGCILYYSGDFDPEGLQIADKLKVRYGEKMVLWHYEKADYEKAKSDKVVSKARLAKLDKVASVELQELVRLVRGEKLAGYQEALVGEYEVINE